MRYNYFEFRLYLKYFNVIAITHNSKICTFEEYTKQFEFKKNEIIQILYKFFIIFTSRVNMRFK